MRSLTCGHVPIQPYLSLPLTSSLSSLSYHSKFKEPNSQKCTVKVNNYQCDFMRVVVLNFGNLSITPHLWYCSYCIVGRHYTSKFLSFASAACYTASRSQSRSDLWLLFYLEWKCRKLEHLLLWVIQTCQHIHILRRGHTFELPSTLVRFSRFTSLSSCHQVITEVDSAAKQQIPAQAECFWPIRLLSLHLTTPPRLA